VLATAALTVHRAADAANVLALWRLLVGTPLLLLQVAAVSAAALAVERPLLILGYPCW
jgi:hypothetical protein